MTSTARKYYKKAKKFFKKRYGGGMRGIARLARDVNTLKTAINVEKKYWTRMTTTDRTLSTTAPYAYHPWDAVSQGAAEENRIGDQVKALWTNVRVDFENTSADLTQAAACKIRVIAVIDWDSRFEAALNPDVLRDYILYDASDPKGQLLSGYKVNHVTAVGGLGERFTILRDFRFQLDNVEKKNKTINLNFNHTKNKYKGLKLRYDDATNNPNPRMYVLCLTDSSGSAGAVVTNWYSRVCYVDN